LWEMSAGHKKREVKAKRQETGKREGTSDLSP